MDIEPVLKESWLPLKEWLLILVFLLVEWENAWDSTSA